MSERYARSCSGKKRFPSERRAEEAARTSQRKFGIALNAYYCQFCKGFHIGATYPWEGRTAREEAAANER